MEKISREQFLAITHDQRILEQDEFGIKVLETDDNRIIKIFRLKRKFSSAMVWPYARRFQHNAERLHKLGIPALTVERIAYCRAEKRHLVVYPKLEGSPLRTCLQREFSSELLEKFATFIATLHQRGVYFRSLHMGNVIVRPSGELALIDVADMRIFRRPLSPNRRARNFHHLLRYPRDRALIERYGFEQFFARYCHQTGFTVATLERFRRQLARVNQIRLAF